MVHTPSNDPLGGSSHHSYRSNHHEGRGRGGGRNPQYRQRDRSVSADSSLNSSNHSQSSSYSPRHRSGRRKEYSSLDESSLHSNSSHSTGSTTSTGSGRYIHTYKKPEMPSHSQYVAMDCEMVGTINGDSVCARVVLTDWKGRVVLDAYVKPNELVTDYRTFVSGITEEDLAGAEPLESVRAEVLFMIEGKILVGHGLQNDLKCLEIDHPWTLIRDTAVYEPFMKDHHGTIAPRKLKELAKERLNREIQVPGKAHSPVEDAVAALDLYKSHRPRWEACMQAKIREAHRLARNEARQQQQQMLQYQYYPAVPVPMAYVPSQYMH